MGSKSKSSIENEDETAEKILVVANEVLELIKGAHISFDTLKHDKMSYKLKRNMELNFVIFSLLCFLSYHAST